MPNRFPYVKRGYDPDVVDEKIEALEEVVKSYKTKDAAIKNAILNAQIAADNIVLNAKNHAADMRNEAIMQLEDIKLSVLGQRKLLKDFENDYNALLSKYVKNVSLTDFQGVYSKIDALETMLNDLSREDETPTPEKMTAIVFDAEE